MIIPIRIAGFIFREFGGNLVASRELRETTKQCNVAVFVETERPRTPSGDSTRAGQARLQKVYLSRKTHLYPTQSDVERLPPKHFLNCAWPKLAKQTAKFVVNADETAVEILSLAPSAIHAGQPVVLIVYVYLGPQGLCVSEVPPMRSFYSAHCVTPLAIGEGRSRIGKERSGGKGLPSSLVEGENFRDFGGYPVRGGMLVLWEHPCRVIEHGVCFLLEYNCYRRLTLWLEYFGILAHRMLDSNDSVGFPQFTEIIMKVVVWNLG
ncbi:hypothetical protein BJ742DRAFT_743857 [Cladochytrium replicatum]|nr:hypothetical protein BJ742DRAFT_743857 [Cladochytrium replicatum]